MTQPATVVLIRGDGIGPEIAAATVRAVEAAGAAIRWEEALAGEAALQELGDPLPEASLELLRRHRVALKAPLATPSGGGYVSVNCGSAPEANLSPIGTETAEAAMDSAACIGCGACVASCPNASAALFTGAKIRHLRLLPQGEPERRRRVLGMIAQMDAEGFGDCSNHGECEAACPKSISIDNIAELRREYLRAMFVAR